MPKKTQKEKWNYQTYWPNETKSKKIKHKVIYDFIKKVYGGKSNWYELFKRDLLFPCEKGKRGYHPPEDEKTLRSIIMLDDRQARSLQKDFGSVTLLFARYLCDAIETYNEDLEYSNELSKRHASLEISKQRLDKILAFISDENNFEQVEWEELEDYKRSVRLAHKYSFFPYFTLLFFKRNLILFLIEWNLVGDFLSLMFFIEIFSFTYLAKIFVEIYIFTLKKLSFI